MGGGGGRWTGEGEEEDLHKVCTLQQDSVVVSYVTDLARSLPIDGKLLWIPSWTVVNGTGAIKWRHTRDSENNSINHF